MVDRSRFGSWGVELSEDDLSRAVAGVLQSRKPTTEPVLVREWKTPARKAAFYRDGARAGTRFQVSAELLDIAAILSRPAAEAGSVFVERELEEATVVWTYPLRIGILPGYREGAARAIADISWTDVYELVELSASAGECDILLLPGNFRSSLAALLERRLSLHADLALVMGKLDQSGAKALRLIDVMRDAADAAGVAVADQPAANRVEWFRRFIMELTHDRPLDVALFAQNGNDSPPPLLVASRKLIDAAQIRRHIRKMAASLERIGTREISMAAPRMVPMSARPRAIADAMRSTIDDAFLSELGPASTFGRMARDLPPGLRSPAAVAAPGKPDQRRVVHGTYDERGKSTKTLARAKTYRVTFRIGFPGAEETSATAPFPHHLLPASESGHRLTVVFAELPQSDQEDFRQPEVRELLLPPVEESEPVEFWFRTRDGASRFDARVIVLHQNRVLQTLRYGAMLDGRARIRLDAELDVYRLDNLAGRTRFDAALVVNESAGRMAVCEIVDGKARYHAPAGLEKQVEKVSEILDAATKLTTLPKKLADPKLLDVMLKLSYEGNALWTALRIEDDKRLADAGSVQVVAARAGEYLPAEFLYGRPVPLQSAMCGHAAAALQKGKNEPCTTQATALSKELCPAKFWALDRVIEHVPWGDPLAAAAAPTVPTKPLFSRALLGVSKKVLNRSMQKLLDALNTATNGNATLAKSWDEWTERIDEEQPSLLVLLAHSGIHALSNKPGLEIGGETLPIEAFEEVHVRKPGSGDVPILLLFGCDTVRAPIPYQNAVERFKAKHAGLVVGTLSTVLGRHASKFAIALVEALAASAGKANKFGEVLLDVKRKRIVAGDPFALTLVAYGDSEIRI